MKTWGDALAAVRDAIAGQDWDHGERVLAMMQENAERSAEPSQLASVAFQRGIFEDARGQLGAAEAAFAEAVSWDERHAGQDSHAVADALRSLGIVRARMKKTDLAVTTFEQASRAYVVQRSTDAIETMTRAGRALEDAGRFDEAITRYTAAERLLPDLDTPEARTERVWAIVGESECLRRAKEYAISREVVVRATRLAEAPRNAALSMAIANAWIVLSAHARHVLHDEKLAVLALAMARTCSADPRIAQRAERDIAASRERALAPARIEGWVIASLHPDLGAAEVMHVDHGLCLARGAIEGLVVGQRAEVVRDASGVRLVR